MTSDENGRVRVKYRPTTLFWLDHFWVKDNNKFSHPRKDFPIKTLTLKSRETIFERGIH